MSTTSTNSNQPNTDAATCIKLQTGHLDCHAEFYPQQYQLLLKGAAHEEKVDLGYAGSRLLERLVQNPGEVVPREALLSYAWSERVVGQGSLNQQVYTLRQLLGDEKKREIIQTLPRRGYLFNPLSLINEQSSKATEAPANPTTPVAQRKNAGKHLNHLLLVSNLVLAVVLLTSGYRMLLPNAQASSQQGLLRIHYAASSLTQLEQLQSKTASLTRQLEQMAPNTGQIYISQLDSHLELQCIDQQNSQRWLKIDSSRLDNLPESLLQRCFN